MKITMPNLKGSGNFAEVLLAHGEKVGVAVVALCVAWMIYAVMGLDAATVQPDALRGLAQSANQNVEKLQSVDDLPETEKLELQTIDAAAATKTVSVAPYEIDVPLNPPEFPRKLKRIDPELLTPVELEVTADIGLIAYKRTEQETRPIRPLPAPEAKKPELRSKKRRDAKKRDRDGKRPTSKRRRKQDDAGDLIPRKGADRAEEKRPKPTIHIGPRQAGGVRVGSGDKVEVRAWVVVLAKVPVAKQAKVFERAFRDAEGWDAEQDQPGYLGYYVERAEFDGTGKPAWKKIKAISARRLTAVKQDWGGTGPAAEVAGLPYVDPKLLTFPLPPRVDRAWNESVCHRDIPLQSALDQQTPQKTGDVESDAGEDSFISLDDSSGGPRGDKEPGAATLRRPTGKGAEGAARARSGHLLREVDYKLFRFFDMTARPGKKYQYRVQLVLVDPNHAVPVMYLADEVIKRRSGLTGAKELYRVSAWSDASPVVSVPSAGRLIAGPARAVRLGDFFSEPSVTLLARMFDGKRDIEGVAEVTTVIRGTLGNFKKDIPAPQYAVRQASTTIENFEFRTDTTVVDIRGGDILSRHNRSFTAPSQVLMADASGNLFVRTETGDRQDYQWYKEVSPAEAEAKPRRAPAETSGRK